MTDVQLHPNFGDRVIRVAGMPYHWDGALAVYCRGYGPYAQAAMIGDWTIAPRKQANRLSREVRRA